MFVHESIYDDFMEQFIAKTKKLQSGNPFDKGTHLGSIISQNQLDIIDGYVQSAREDGATIATGGNVMKIDGFENGYWYEPTVITDVTPDMKAVKEEIFGPVVVVEKFTDEKEVIQRANDTDYGLGSAIWTKDQGRATRVSHQIKAGIVMVNNPFSAFPGTPLADINNPDWPGIDGRNIRSLYGR